MPRCRLLTDTACVRWLGRYFQATSLQARAAAVLQSLPTLWSVELPGLLLLLSHIADLFEYGQLFEAEPARCLTTWLVVANALGPELVCTGAVVEVVMLLGVGPCRGCGGGDLT